MILESRATPDEMLRVRLKKVIRVGSKANVGERSERKTEPRSVQAPEIISTANLRLPLNLMMRHQHAIDRSRSQ